MRNRSLHAVAAAMSLSVATLRAQVQAPAASEQTAEESARIHRLLDAQTYAPAPALASPSAGGAWGETARDGVFHSEQLQRDMRYRVLLPPSYEREHRYYPVLYMLHGFLNPYYEWDRQTTLAVEAAKYDLVVVLVQGDNSFYLNSASAPKDRYMSYFFRDLLPEIRGHYRVMSETYGQAIAGVSMGGYGALLYGLRFPGAFAFVGSFAGVPNLMSDDELQKNLEPFGATAAFGPRGGETRTENDPMALLRKVEKGTPLPYFFLQVGNDDEFLPQNLTFAAELREHGVAHELHLAPGAHEWDVWNRALPAFFQALARAMPIASKQSGAGR